MSLEVKILKKPSGPHLLVSDGCKVDLTRDQECLSDEQLEGIDPYYDDRLRRAKYLLYLNIAITDILFLRGEISVRCPVCETTYTISSEQYNDLKSAGK